MEIPNWKYLLGALIIGVIIGWYLFRSPTHAQFVGISPLLDQLASIGNLSHEIPSDDILSIPTEELKHRSFRTQETELKPILEHQKLSQPSFFVSKGEEECRKAAKNVFGKDFVKVRPKWLLNPKTGKRMEIDLYNEELKIGIEYNGRQHYVFPNGMHHTEDEFKNQQERDRIKLDICDRNGVYLISVPYTVPLNRIEDYIEYYRPEKRAERLLNGETGSPS